MGPNREEIQHYLLDLCKEINGYEFYIVQSIRYPVRMKIYNKPSKQTLDIVIVACDNNRWIINDFIRPGCGGGNMEVDFVNHNLTISMFKEAIELWENKVS